MNDKILKIGFISKMLKVRLFTKKFKQKAKKYLSKSQMHS